MAIQAVLFGISLCRQTSLFQIKYGPPVQFESWEIREAQCHSNADQTTFYKFSSTGIEGGAVDNSDTEKMRKICHSYNMELPSVHNDLDNWCILNAGAYGTKTRVVLGIQYNESSKEWAWYDGSPYNFTKIWPPFWEKPDGEHKWCARLISSLYWTPYMCNMSDYHNQKDYVICQSNKTMKDEITQEPNASLSSSKKEGDLGVQTQIIITICAVVIVLGGVYMVTSQTKKEGSPIIIEENDIKNIKTPNNFQIMSISNGDEELYDTVPNNDGTDDNTSTLYYQAQNFDGEGNYVYDRAQNLNIEEDGGGYLIPKYAQTENEDDFSQDELLGLHEHITSSNSSEPYDLAYDVENHKDEEKDDTQ